MKSFTLHIFLSSIESETRLYKEAAYTLKHGICSRVVVLGLWDKGLKKNETTFDDLEIIRIATLIRNLQKTSVFYRISFFKKIISLFSLIQYAISCIIAARHLRPNHVSCHNALMLPIAWLVAKVSRATLEYLPHELEIERTGLQGFLKKLTSLMESFFIKSARNIVVVCEPIKDWYKKKYNLDNIYVVKNTPEIDAIKIKPLNKHDDFRSKFNIPDQAKLFIYQGQFSVGRGIELLIEAFSKLDASKCHIVFMGFADGNYQSLVNNAVERHSNIHFQPAVPRDMIISYSACADIGIFIAEKVSLCDAMALPNKFFEWAHAGLPILVSKNLEYQASILKDRGFGWSAEIENITTVIENICNTEISSYKKNAINYASENYWENDAKVFSQIYKN